jgi:hypothetical protein
MIQRSEHWVVRAGLASPAFLRQGYSQHKQRPVYGFSVQYDPTASVDELAKAGQWKNGQISYATRADLEAALIAIGYSMQLIKTPGKGYHHTFMVLYAANQMLTSLPSDAAQVISNTFSRKPNPYPIP